MTILGPVERASSLTDRVAHTLLTSILSGRWKAGERLPPERELSASLEVSRTVIREAIRYLAAKGVVEVFTGSGVRVAEVHPSAVRETMRLYLHGQTGIGYVKVHEVRAMIEVHIATVAATSAQPDSLSKLRDELAAMEADIDDPRSFAHRDLEFHRALGQSTGNELYVTVLDAIGDALLEIRMLTSESRARRMQALIDHGRILANVERHDSLAARKAMEEHLAYTLNVCQDLEAAAIDDEAEL